MWPKCWLNRELRELFIPLRQNAAARNPLKSSFGRQEQNEWPLLLGSLACSCSDSPFDCGKEPSGLRFLYKKVLKRCDPAFDDLPFPKTPKKLPACSAMRKSLN